MPYRKYYFVSNAIRNLQRTQLHRCHRIQENVVIAYIIVYSVRDGSSGSGPQFPLCLVACFGSSAGASSATIVRAAAGCTSRTMTVVEPAGAAAMAAPAATVPAAEAMPVAGANFTCWPCV